MESLRSDDAGSRQSHPISGRAFPCITAKLGAEEYGLDVTMHAHAAGFVEFEDEIEDVLNAIDPKLLGVCLDTGHWRRRRTSCLTGTCSRPLTTASQS